MVGKQSLARGSLRWLCWLPLAALLAVEWYIRDFDGWGAWASAPLLLVPALISILVATAGLFDCVSAKRAGVPIRAPLFFTLISTLPVLWLGVRRFFV